MRPVANLLLDAFLDFESRLSQAKQGLAVGMQAANAEFTERLKEKDESIAGLQARIDALEKVMVLHFITTGDDGLPEGEQGDLRAREFKYECGRIIQRNADELATR